MKRRIVCAALALILTVALFVPAVSANPPDKGVVVDGTWVLERGYGAGISLSVVPVVERRVRTDPYYDGLFMDSESRSYSGGHVPEIVEEYIIPTGTTLTYKPWDWQPDSFLSIIKVHFLHRHEEDNLDVYEYDAWSPDSHFYFKDESTEFTFNEEGMYAINAMYGYLSVLQAIGVLIDDVDVWNDYLIIKVVGATSTPPTTSGNNAALGNVLHTDIRVFIDNVEIAGYNINGSTYVIAEDLRPYGFSVLWNSSARTLSVTQGSATGSVKAVPLNADSVGSVAFPYVDTDIRTYIDGEEVTSYNIRGQTVVLIDDVARAYGSRSWDSANRELRITT